MIIRPYQVGQAKGLDGIPDIPASPEFRDEPFFATARGLSGGTPGWSGARSMRSVLSYGSHEAGWRCPVPERLLRAGR